MSRLDFETSYETKEKYYLLAETEYSTPPFDLQLIAKEQEKCTQLQLLKIKGTNVTQKEMTAGLSLWHFKPRRGMTYLIYVSKKLQTPLVEWYNETLKHRCNTRTKGTIGQHYAWPDYTKTIEDVVRKCVC